MLLAFTLMPGDTVNGTEDDASSDTSMNEVSEVMVQSMAAALRSAGVASSDTSSQSKPIGYSVSVLDRLVDEYSITDVDSFIEYASNMDHDEDNYLKEDELLDAAKKWKSEHSPQPVVDEIVDVETEHSEVDELLELGEECSRRNDVKGALTSFNKAIALDPSCDMAWFNRGVLLEAEQDARGARQAFQICLDINPEHAPATANLSILLERIGDESGAYAMAIRALEFFPGHPTLVEVKQRCAESVNEVSIDAMPVEEPSQSYAEDDVTQVMEEVGVDDAEAILSEARHHDADGNQHLEYDELKAAAEVVAATQEIQSQMEPTEVAATAPVQPPEPVLEPKVIIDLDALVEQATDLIRSGDAENALGLLSPHLKTIGANHPGAWRIAGGAMARLNLDDHAISALEHAQKLDPSQGSGWFNLGSIHQRQKNAEKAIECYMKAMEVQPNYLKAALKCSTLASESGHIESYLTATRTVLQIDPTNAVREAFIVNLIELAEGEANVLNVVQGLPPTLPEGPHLAKEALRYLGDGETHLHARAFTAAKEDVQAVTVWKSMIKNTPNDPAIWRGLAKSLESAGDLDTAQKCHHKAQSLEATNGGAVAPPPETVPVATLEPVPTPVPIPETAPAPVLTPEPLPEAILEPVPSPVPTAVDVSPQEQEADYYMNALGLQNPSSPQTPLAPVEQIQPTVDLAQVAAEAKILVDSEVSNDVNSMSVANQDIAWYNQGIGLIEDGKYREALSCFDRALPSFASNDEMLIRILNGRGNAYYFLEQYPKCVESYHQAMLIRPAEVEGKTLYNMGSAYAEMERYADAIKCFEQSMPRNLSPEQVKRAKEQIRRCGILLKDAARKSNRR